jgi:hypothetical protein
MSTEPGSDPVGDFQRWLMRTGAKSIGRDVASRVRSTIGGGGGAKQGDVWDTATTEEPTDEPPECQWCPICRAARRYRDTGGSTATLSGQFAGVGDTLAGLTRDAFGLFDAAMRASQRPADPSRGPGGPGGPGGTGSSTGGRPTGKPARPDDGQAAGSGPAASGTANSGTADSDHGTVVVGPGIGWPTVVHAEHQDDEPADERGDREEGGEPGDGGADGGTDEQVERTAE